MRRQFVSQVLAGLVVMIASLGFTPMTDEQSNTDGGPTVAVQRVNVHVSALGDGAAMVLVGAALIGLAAVVRRAA
ncbi:MAG: hypothetical protein ACRD15_11355 [Vicinamibacterales bacterium]